MSAASRGRRHLDDVISTYPALLSLVCARQSSTSVDQLRRYSSSQPRQSFIDTTRTTTTTTDSNDAVAAAADDVTDDDVIAVDEGHGKVQGQSEGQEAATNEKTELRSRDTRQQTSSFTRHSDDGSYTAHDAVSVNSRLRAAAALQWWNAVRLASLHPWLARSSAFMRRAALNPYPILHRRQQHVVMETDDVTLVGGERVAVSAKPDTVEKCDPVWKKPMSPSFAHA